MKKFIGRLTFFLLPLAFYLGAVCLVLAPSGELMPLDGLVTAHGLPGRIIGLAYSDPVKPLKMATLRKRHPEIIALGTSRVMQFRDFFFNSRVPFYNAGGSISKVGDLNAFLTALGPTPPRVLLLGLDHNFFNKNWDDLSGPPVSYQNDTSLVQIIRKQRVVKDLLKGKILLDKLVSSPHIGLTAKRYNQGFRADGSYQYGKILTDPALAEDKNFEDSFNRIRNGIHRFEYGREVNPRAISVLADFLHRCREKKIAVVAFLPPYANAVWDRLKTMPDHYAYIFSLYKTLSPLFSAANYELYDFSDLAELGGSDRETIDGFHGSEVLYLRMTVALGQKSRILSPFIDLKKLHPLLESAFSYREIIKTTLF